MAISQAYSDTSVRELAAEPRARLGGPRPTGPAIVRESWLERFTAGPVFGSHMPLDIDIHWEWRNPLNLIPAMILLLIVLALVAAIV